MKVALFTVSFSVPLIYYQKLIPAVDYDAIYSLQTIAAN